jgi:hypothetical protein
VIVTAPPAIMWQHPNRAPYMGTFDQAVAAFAIPPPPRPMQCHYRDIWAGERFTAMMFGRDRVELNVVADTDDWPAADTRVAEDCWFLAAGSEYHLVRPLVCGNWALEVLPIAGWWPGGHASGQYSGNTAQLWGEEGWSAGGYGWGAYGLAGGYGVPVSYEVPGPEIGAPSEAAAGFAGIPVIGSSEYPSGGGGSGAGGRVAVPEPPGLLMLALGVLAVLRLRRINNASR